MSVEIKIAFEWDMYSYIHIRMHKMIVAKMCCWMYRKMFGPLIRITLGVAA